MAFSYGGAPIIKEREYLYIDGGSLRAAVEKISYDTFGDRKAYQPLIGAFATGYDKVFYYDAVSGKEHDETQPAYELRAQPEYDHFDKIQALDRVHVQLGQVVGTQRRQKGVDVRLAVDMMTHAFRGNIIKATIFAGDADFVPLIRALVSEGMHVNLWHPPQANSGLRGAADTNRPFNFREGLQYFSADGLNPAFRSEGILKGGTPADHRMNNIFTVGRYTFASLWQAGLLRIGRAEASGDWDYASIHSRELNLQRAIKAHDAHFGWDIEGLGQSWIDRI